MILQIKYHNCFPFNYIFSAWQRFVIQIKVKIQLNLGHLALWGEVMISI